MLGYAYVNQFIQKYSIENIIICFLNRVIVVNAPFLVGLKILANRETQEVNLDSFLQKDVENFENCEDEVENLFQLFLLEEYTLTKFSLSNKQGSSLEVDYQKELYKYILSANVMIDKNYDFSKKLKEQIISDGIKNLKIIFESILIEFLNNVLFLKGKDERITNLLLTTNIFLSTNIKTNLFLLLERQRQDIKLGLDSGVNNFYNFYKFFEVRNNYLESLKNQVSPENKRII